MIEDITNWLSEPVDLCIVIGTSGTVYPAAGYTPVVSLIHIHTVADCLIGMYRMSKILEVRLRWWILMFVAGELAVIVVFLIGYSKEMLLRYDSSCLILSRRTEWLDLTSVWC